MKKLSFLSLIIITTLNFAYAQAEYTKHDIKTVNKLVWFGLDFSKANLRQGFYHPHDVQEAYINGWNDIILSPEFDLKELLGKDSVVVDLSIVTYRNKNRTNYYFKLVEDTIQKVLHEYKIGEREGIGLVFIVDEFRKSDEKAIVWVTFFDISTRKLLNTQQVAAYSSGSGMVKHWSKATKQILKKVPGLIKKI